MPDDTAPTLATPAPSPGRLHDKVALVTGAARGIGLAIARAFLAEGARGVVLADINDAAGDAAAADLDESGQRARFVHLDVRREEDWSRAMAEAVIEPFGRLDVLVNNAGITGFAEAELAGHAHDAEHASLEAWHAVLRTNLDGVFLGCREAIRVMRRQAAGGFAGAAGMGHRGNDVGGPTSMARTGAISGPWQGSIINIGSRSGVVGIPGAAAYAASKAAVANHTRTVALYCAQERLPIRCNVIQPTAILTPMWSPLLGDEAADPEGFRARMTMFAADCPLQRFGTVDEVAALAVYLASDAAAYVTGTAINIDGGTLAGSISISG